MIRAFLVDDEQPALLQLNQMLSEFKQINVTGMFTDPREALKKLKRQQPDVIFLDIDMPYVRGTEFAAELRAMNLDIVIVFVTAYSEFALESYAVYPLDYLMKPIDKSRLDRTVGQIAAQVKRSGTALEEAPVFKIQCFGRLEVTKSFRDDKDEVQQEQLTITNRKVKELLCYLLANFQLQVFRDELLDMLFDGARDEKTINYLHVTAYSLRKLLEEFGLVQLKLDRYALTVPPGVCDFVDFSRFIRANAVIDENNLAEAERALKSYHGPLLSDEDYPWSVETREWAEEQLEALSVKLVEYYDTADMPQGAEQVLLAMLQRNPFSEQSHQMLLDVYYSRNMHSKFIRHYRRYRDVLDEELGVEPEEKYTRIYEQLLNSDLVQE